jgi:hypothetical protein
MSMIHSLNIELLGDCQKAKNGRVYSNQRFRRLGKFCESDLSIRTLLLPVELPLYDYIYSMVQLLVSRIIDQICLGDVIVILSL